MITFILAIIIALVLAITFHELGHYFALRRYGVKIDRFALGFGPVLFQRVDKHGTAWQFRLFPAGGFVKPADRDAFDKLPPGRMAVTYLAGPLANLATAFIAVLLLGLLVPGKGSLLLMMALFGLLFWQILISLPNALLGTFSFQASSDHLMGPVGIFTTLPKTVSEQAANVGVLYEVILLFVLLSMGLAVFNLLPLTPLDGSGIFRAGLKKALSGKALSVTTRVFNHAGFFVFMALILFVNVKDVLHLF